MNKTERIIKKSAAFVGALAILAMTFFAGYFTRYYTLSAEVRNFMWVMDKIQSNYYGQVDSNELYDFALNTLIYKLDPYYAYYSKEDYQRILAEQQGEKSGFGVVLFDNDGDCTLFMVSGNSPAERAGLTRGDVLIGAAKSGEEIYRFESYEDAYEKIRAIPSGELWDIEIIRSSTAEIQIVSLKKEVYEEGFVYYGDSNGYYGYVSENGVMQLTPLSDTVSEFSSFDSKTGYIKLTGFSGGAAAQFAGALTKFKAENKSKLILDLRNNGGGYMNILMSITEHLVQSQTHPLYAAIAVNKSGQRAVYPLTNSFYSSYGFEKIAVLANENTASASECLIGAMIDYGTLDYDFLFISEHEDNADATTYGKGIMQTTFANAATGSAVKLTTAGIFWPVSEKSIHGVGISGIAVKTDGYKSFYITDNELSAAAAALFNL